MERNSNAPDTKTSFSYLSGTATITIWQGTTVGTGGTQLGSTSSFTSSVPVINTSVGGGTFHVIWASSSG